MKIAVILPTRGIVFTEVEDSLSRVLKPYDYTIYRSWGLGIPGGVNTLTEKALATEPDYLFFVEEDVVIPDEGVKKLLALDADIACIDYGVAGWGCVTKNKEGEILWCGMGCTLVKKSVFAGLDRPYFRSDIELRLNDWQWVPSPPNKYGGQDIYFCMKAREKGFSIKQAESECRHLKLEALGRPEVNTGGHIIIEKHRIVNHQVL